MREIVIGKKYRHFKGQIYKVIDIAYDSEIENNKIVIYEAQYGDHKHWARPYDMFASLVDKEKYPDVKQKYRFEEIE